MPRLRRDVEHAVTLLCRGNDFAEAKRILTTYSRLDLIEVTLHPSFPNLQAPR